jgi:hypothetical protein
MTDHTGSAISKIRGERMRQESIRFMGQKNVLSYQGLSYLGRTPSRMAI